MPAQPAMQSAKRVRYRLLRARAPISNSPPKGFAKTFIWHGCTGLNASCRPPSCRSAPPTNIPHSIPHSSTQIPRNRSKPCGSGCEHSKALKMPRWRLNTDHENYRSDSALESATTAAILWPPVYLICESRSETGFLQNCIDSPPWTGCFGSSGLFG